MSNTAGNLSKCKTESQVLIEATKLQGMYASHAAKKIGMSVYRLKRIADKHGLIFLYRGDSYLSDQDIAEHIVSHQHTDSPYTLAIKIGAGSERIIRVSDEIGVKLNNKREWGNQNPMRCVDGYWLKTCSKCKEEKGAEMFDSDPTAKCGFYSQCRSCKSARRKK